MGNEGIDAIREVAEAYIEETSRSMPFIGEGQLTDMVILHFDIPDAEAKAMVKKIFGQLGGVSNG